MDTIVKELYDLVSSMHSETKTDTRLTRRREHIKYGNAAKEKQDLLLIRGGCSDGKSENIGCEPHVIGILCLYPLFSRSRAAAQSQIQQRSCDSNTDTDHLILNT